MAQCAALVGGKNRDAKNHRSGARGTTQKTGAFFENTALSKLYFRFQKNLGFGLWGVLSSDLVCFVTSGF